MDDRSSRRSLLRAGAAAGALALAGCLTAGDGESGSTGTAPASDRSPSADGPTTVDGVAAESATGGATDGAGGRATETGDGAAAWPMFQFGPAHAGSHRSASGPGDSPAIRWRIDVSAVPVDVGDDVRGLRFSRPVVADGTVYATVSSRSGAMGDALVAVDAASGEVKQSVRLVEPYRQAGASGARPTVVDGTAYVTIPNVLDRPQVAAVDLDAGEVAWRGVDGDGAVTATTAATVRGEQIVVGGETVFALDRDGTRLWTFEAPMADGSDRTRRARAGWPPTVTAERAYVSASGPSVHALSRDGSKLWSRDVSFESDLNDYTVPYTAVVGDAVYVAAGAERPGGDGRLYALDPADGHTRWQFQPSFDRQRRADAYEELRGAGVRDPVLGVGVYGTPALASGTLYAVGLTLPDPASVDGDRFESVARLYALDAASGERRWATALPGHFGSAPPVVADGTVYVSCVDGFAAIDAASGERLAARDLDLPSGGAAAGGMAVADDAVIATTGGTLYALGP